jgi:hypothetical protein
MKTIVSDPVKQQALLEAIDSALMNLNQAA